MGHDEVLYAWLAGLIDGEGCIRVYRRGYHGQITNNFQAEVTLSNTCKELLDTVHSRVGSGNVSPAWKPANTNQKAAYKWYAGIQFVRDMLPQICPYLIVKRQQAELAIEAANIMQENAGRQYTLTHDGLDRLSRLLEITELSSKLNKRGTKGLT